LVAFSDFHRLARFSSPTSGQVPLLVPVLHFHALTGADSAARRPESHKRCFEGELRKAGRVTKDHPFSQSMKKFDVLSARLLAHVVSTDPAAFLDAMGISG
jgi:hypothetical protein